jgi:hypothetical protein
MTYRILTDILCVAFGVMLAIVIPWLWYKWKDIRHEKAIREIEEQEAWEEWKETR